MPIPQEKIPTLTPKLNAQQLNHPEMEDCEENLKQTVRFGRRIQDSLNPQKYRYSKEFDDLAEDNTHIVAIVLCRYWSGKKGQPVPNNYIVTAYQKVMG